MRAAAEEVGATQFEILTGAALLDFAERGTEVAVLEAGLGGRLDATNAVDGRVVLLTNVGLEHTAVLGETRRAIAIEKLAIAGPGAAVVLPDQEFADLVAGPHVVVGGAREAATVYLGRPVEAEVDVRLPGRLEVRGDEVRDGAHTPGPRLAARRLPEPHEYVVVASILDDKDAAGILEASRRPATPWSPTRSSNDRALAPARRRARRGAVRDGGHGRRPARGARPRSCPRPAGARDRLALSPCRPRRKRLKLHTMSRSSERISVFLFALGLLALFVGLAFAAGYALGRILL